MDLGELGTVLQDHLVTRADDGELLVDSLSIGVAVGPQVVLEDAFPFCWSAVVHDHWDRWRPLSELVHPVGERAKRRYD